MKIVTLREPSFENVKLKKLQMTDDCMYVDIKNGKNRFYLQTPKMFCSKLESDSKKVKLYFDNRKKNNRLSKFYTLVNDFEEKVCELVSENSKKWFPSFISKEQLMEKFFKPSIKISSHLEDPVYLYPSIPHVEDGFNFEIYNQKREKVDVKTIKNDTDVVTILLAKDLIITSSSVHISWEVAQMKVFQIKEKIVGCGIIDDDEDEITPKEEKLKEKRKEKKEIIKTSIKLIDTEENDD